ncbi:MAG: hypothetical protein ACE5E9_02205 [Nitrospinaceae bacterium]
MNKDSLINIAGILWGFIGVFLIYRGIHFYQIAIDEQHSTKMALWISVIACLVIGSAKGHFVLSKTARKNKSRILNLESPLKIHHIFSKPFYGFIAAMMFLGILLRSLNTYLGGYIVIAPIYCGIGLALIVGSRVYWKAEPGAPVEENP